MKPNFRIRELSNILPYMSAKGLHIIMLNEPNGIFLKFTTASTPFLSLAPYQVGFCYCVWTTCERGLVLSLN